MTKTDLTTFNLLKFTLLELENRQKFDTFVSQTDEHVSNYRRPYLGKVERDVLEDLPVSVLQEYFEPGEFIHIPMTGEERISIARLIKFKQKFQTLDASDHLNYITDTLPGRQLEDLQNYLTDLENDTLTDSILVFAATLESCPSISLNGQLFYSWTESLKKQFSICDSSGSITSIVCRTGLAGKNSRIMISACATQDERYNRVGELIISYKENSSSAYEAVILDGHKKAKTCARGSVLMRQTVSCAIYDPLLDLFFSGGYDGEVVAWSADKCNLLDSIGGHSKPINSIACHPSSPLIAYGSQNGSVYTFNSFSKLGSAKALPSLLFSKPKARESFFNSVDHVLIPQTGMRTDNCFAGIGYSQAISAGIIEEWDLVKGSIVSASEQLPSGLTCMNISNCGKYIAAGTGGIASDDDKGDGIIRILDINSDMKTSMAIQTKKYDLDCISFCPTGNMLFTGETSDNSIEVYDLRFPKDPIFATSHGTNGTDSIVAHTWISKGHVLATGGHDGLLKLWDCKRGFSLLNELEFNSSISCITYSEVDHSIWLGTDNGAVHMIATPGSIDEGHSSHIFAKCYF